MRLLAIRHVKAEHLGLIEDIARKHSWEFHYLDIAGNENQTDDIKKNISNYSLVVILGGYMGVYEEEKYPFLTKEFRLVEECVKMSIPTLGICLGAQILAKVLGAKVFRGEKGKEIGWFDVIRTKEHPLFSDFPEKLRVFQWHGDTFDLPKGAERIFSSEKYENQAFVYEGKIVGLQFHLEMKKEMIHEWAKLYKDELEKEKIDERDLLDVDENHIKKLENLTEKLIMRLMK